MIVLQALWEIDKGLHLWAETSEARAGAQLRREKAVLNRSHPFILPYDRLLKLATSLSHNLNLKAASPGDLSVLLPTAADAPLPSSECLGLVVKDPASDSLAVQLAPWQIGTLSLPPDTALDFLCALDSHPPGGVDFSRSLCFWAELSKLSLELVARESFLPGLRQEEHDGVRCLIAGWEPVIEGKDRQRIKLMADRLPPVCRAVQYPDRSIPSPAVLVLNFLRLTVDNFIRKSLAAEPQAKLRVRTRKALSDYERWVEALSLPGKLTTAPIALLGHFAKDLDSWLNRVRAVPEDAALRTSFLLQPPEGGQSHWRIIFQLQAGADRSLLIPAEKVWQARSGEIAFSEQRFENLQERLLADLGKASAIFPPIEDSLKTARPVGIQIDTQAAYLFLRQYASLLEQSGFGVVLPAWWHKPHIQLGAKLKLKPLPGTEGPGSGLMGLNAIVAYEWEIALGDSTLSRKEFEELAGLKLPLVKIRGQWVELRSEFIKAALVIFKKGEKGEIKLSEAIRAGLGHEVPEAGLPVTAVEPEGWIKEFLDAFSLDTARMAEIGNPAGFRGQLRPYQITGISWMSFLRQFSLGACLADDMGLGKTVELLALLLDLQNKKQLSGPSLLICPMSVVTNWKNEAERFAPSLKIMVHHGTGRDRGEALLRKARKQDILVTTYALAYRDAAVLSKIDWDCLVLDEAQNIKNSSTRQTQAVKKFNSRYRVALTGTPVENQLSELWSIMEFLNPGYLKSAEDFRTSFAIPIEKYHSPEHAVRLKHLIQPFILRRLKTDPGIINDLPDKIETKVFCNLTREQATLYQAVVKEMLEKIAAAVGIERKGLVLSTLLKLKQVCNHPAQFLQDQSSLPGRSGKLLRLEEILEEVRAEGDKALIFTQFVAMGKILKQHLQEIYNCEVIFMHGATPRKERDAMIQRFQNDRQGPSLFILSLKAGGVGLNLTAANHVFHYDRWWNPAVENQATDRAFRIGQKKNVQVHKFVCLGTLEERIDQMIEQKKELARNIVGSGEGWLTEMSAAQLKQVLTLSRGAVEV